MQYVQRAGLGVGRSHDMIHTDFALFYTFALFYLKLEE